MSDTTSKVHTTGLFDGLTAWFSSSVQQHYKNAWGEADGLMADFDDALYIFSEDATAPDTKSIYESSAYLTNCLAVFHPKYIQECLDIGDLKQVKIGKFFLPPEDIQKAVGWNLDVTTSSTRSPKRRRLSQPVTRPHSNTSQNVALSQPHSVATQTRQVQELSRVSVKPKNPEASVSGSRSAQNSVIGYVRRRERQSNTDKNSDSHTSTQCVSYHVVEGYQPVECLASYSGPLDDFVLGKNGCHATSN